MAADDPLSIALECAARGWAVFPCNAQKQPLTKNGFKDATTDEERIRYFWGKKPQASIGIATGMSGLVVVDLDVKGAANGYDAWCDLAGEGRGRLEATTIVETPSGGQHLYYQANGHKVASSASKLAPGIDVRAEGGYVIAAGSPGYLYVEAHGPERVAHLPGLLARRLVYAENKPSLIPESSLVIPQGRRDATLASIGGTLRRRGVAEAAILAALTAENKAHCRPPLPQKDVERIAHSVARYEPEEAASVAQDDEVSGEVFIDWANFWQRDRSDEEWVYPDVLARGRGHAIYASHKAGKSLLMLYLSAQIATGEGGDVVVYLDYEMTEEDVYDRLDEMGYGPHSDLSRLKYALLPTLPPLDTHDGANALMELLDDVQTEWPERHLVVVIDTVSRAVCGKENDADTFRAFFRLTGIRLKRRGCTWARLDHGGKSPEQGQRGSSSKGDDVDVVWKLTPTQNGIVLHRELSRMSWVPEDVSFTQDDEPLRYGRVAGDWPEGTLEVVNLLDALGLPLDVSTRKAQTAIKEQEGQGRRRKIVCAAVRWRQEEAERVLAKRFRGPSEEAEIETFEQKTLGVGTGSGTTGDHFGGGTGTTLPETGDLASESGSGTTWNQSSGSTGVGGLSLKREPPPALGKAPAKKVFQSIEMGDMP